VFHIMNGSKPTASSSTSCRSSGRRPFSMQMVRRPTRINPKPGSSVGRPTYSRSVRPFLLVGSAPMQSPG
jgi:hypothetical protein